MAENIQRNRGRGQGYKFERGGTPTEFGPYIGVIKNNVDPVRAGRVQVYIEEFGGGNEEDQSLWRSVTYVPPFYGVVEQSGTDKGTGNYIGNPQSYGMWFTPPDIGTKVMCFFASGDPNQGYYTGCVPEIGVNHMIPAVGASKQFTADNSQQQSYLKGASQLPVTEINVQNDEINENPKFYDQAKPVHSYVTAVLLQQGLITDTIRGPITSSSQRESPSTVYGFSTPGRAVTQGGITEKNVAEKANSNTLRKEEIQIIGRRGGHSIVLDDGDINGYDNLIRIRTGKGHQITMSDDGDCFYIIHANGQTWLEFGTEGTVDVYATNSVNIRTQGDLNLHADKNINMYAGEQIKIKSKAVGIASENAMQITGEQLTLFSNGEFGIGSSGSLNIESNNGGWKSGGQLSLSSDRIDLNGGSSAAVEKPEEIEDVELPDVEFQGNSGWAVVEGKLKTIVTRAPTHEPYPYHNRGVEVQVQLDKGSASPMSGVTNTGPALPAQDTGSLTATNGGLSNSLSQPLQTSGLGSVESGLSPSILTNVPSGAGIILGTQSSASNLQQLDMTSISGISGTANVPALDAFTQVTARMPSVSATQGVVTESNLSSQFGQVEAYAVDAFSQINNSPVTIPVNAGQIIKQLPANLSIANLNPSAITGLLASRVADIAQPTQAYSKEKGIGEFGLSPTQLEQLGVIKSGTVARHGSDAAVVEKVINSPTIWTGKYGVRNLQTLLNNRALQGKLQQNLMNLSYSQLQRAGAFSGSESPVQVAGLVQSAIAVGPAGVVNWTKGVASAAVTQQINNISKNAQQAVTSILSNPALGRLGGLIINIAGVVNTVSRTAVNGAVANVINNAKIPSPEFKPIERLSDANSVTGSPDKSGVERINISAIQREAKNKAFAQALARGASEREADTEANEAGNLAGARALRKLQG